MFLSSPHLTPPQEYIRSPSTPLTSPLCRRSIGSEGGPFKPYRSPGPPRESGQPESWRPQTPRSMIEEQLKYIHDVSMLQPQITQVGSPDVKIKCLKKLIKIKFRTGKRHKLFHRWSLSKSNPITIHSWSHSKCMRSSRISRHLATLKRTCCLSTTL